jgi:hypothetical protein
MDITAAAIATLISCCVATTVTFLLNKKSEIKNLNEQLDDIIKISIQFPYLESQSFTQTWNANKDKDDERYLRYENYCTLLFNYLERLCKFYKFDKSKINKFMNVKDWVRLHKDCWLNPSIPCENSDGYCDEFKKLVESYIK